MAIGWWQRRLWGQKHTERAALVTGHLPKGSGREDGGWRQDGLWLPRPGEQG